MSERLSLWPPKRKRQQIEEFVTKHVIEPAEERLEARNRALDRAEVALDSLGESIERLEEATEHLETAVYGYHQAQIIEFPKKEE